MVTVISCGCVGKHCKTGDVKRCDSGVLICIKTYKTEDRTTTDFADCGKSHGSFTCPKKLGVCYETHFHNLTICCCRGNMCNVKKDLVYQPLPEPDFHFQGVEPGNEEIEEFVPDDFQNITIYILTIAIIFLLAFLLCLLYFKKKVWFLPFKTKLLLRQNNPIEQFNQIQLYNMESLNCESIANLSQDQESKASHFGEISAISCYCSKDRILNRGRFGEVWLGTFTKTDVKIGDLSPSLIKFLAENPSKFSVAIKVFSASELRSWENELAFFRLMEVSHSNILRFIGSATIIEKESPCYWIVSEYHEIGNLNDYLHSNTLDSGQVLRFAYTTVCGLHYLHMEQHFHNSKNVSKPTIAHRDVKSKNILIKSDMTCCIADFGLSIKFMNNQSIGDAHFQVGTPRYMSPEVLEGAIQFTKESFLRIDIYALGLVLWELMSRTKSPADVSTNVGEESQNLLNQVPPYKLPFEVELGPRPSTEILQRYIVHDKLRPKPQDWWNTNSLMKDLWITLQQCWDHDSEARISAGCVAERIKSHCAILIPDFLV